MDADALHTAITAKKAAEAFGIYACQTFGARAVDLVDAGYPSVWARTAAAAHPLTIGPADARPIGGGNAFPFNASAAAAFAPAAQPRDLDIVAVVPSTADTAWTTIANFGVYLRDRRLSQPVRWIANYLATDAGGAIPEVYPITARWVCGGPSAQPSHADPVVQAAARSALADPMVAATWPESFDLLVLGAPLPLNLPLGHKGGTMRVRHHHLADLRASSVLKGCAAA